MLKHSWSELHCPKGFNLIRAESEKMQPLVELWLGQETGVHSHKPSSLSVYLSSPILVSLGSFLPQSWWICTANPACRLKNSRSNRVIPIISCCRTAFWNIHVDSYRYCFKQFAPFSNSSSMKPPASDRNAQDCMACIECNPSSSLLLPSLYLSDTNADEP